MSERAANKFRSAYNPVRPLQVHDMSNIIDATHDRRVFLNRILGATVGLAAGVPTLSFRIMGANNRVRLGLIGAGGRGKEIFTSALRCPDTEGVAVADVYTRRLEEVRQLVPGIRAYADFRSLLDD